MNSPSHGNKMLPSIKPTLTLLNLSPWKRGWPRLICSTLVILYILGLLFAFVALNLMNPLTSVRSTRSTYTISGPLYQGNVFTGATSHDLIKTIRMYPDSEGTVQSQAWSCTRACSMTPGCRTFIIRGERCYLTSFSACQNVGKRYLLEWEGATTYELRDDNDTNLHQTCLAKCFETKGCSGCGRPLCNGSSCENCPHTCWQVSPAPTGTTVIYETLGLIKKVTCDGSWQLWWKDGQMANYEALYERFLKVRIVICFTKDQKIQSEFKSFSYENGKISIGKFIQGNAGNAWGAPFESRGERRPPNSNCRSFFYADGDCEANAVESYPNKLSKNTTSSERGYSWKIGDTKLDNSIIESIELWIKPQDSKIGF